ncbi:MAG TPA: multidrug efflux SMR transporter [Bacteroidales bacterium]|nr:multidrug efflux SMR transporter [Bacteroidales bacterium]
MGWIYLIIAGILEIGFATTLKITHDNRNSPWNIVFVLCLVGSFYFLNKSLSTIPIGTAYAIWTGIGAIGTAIIGIIYFKDPVTLARIVFLSLLIISIVGLKLSSASH